MHDKMHDESRYKTNFIYQKERRITLDRLADRSVCATLGRHVSTNLDPDQAIVHSQDSASDLARIACGPPKAVTMRECDEWADAMRLHHVDSSCGYQANAMYKAIVCLFYRSTLCSTRNSTFVYA